MMGWDCVLCMDLSRVNTILNEQYLFFIIFFSCILFVFFFMTHI